jgi:S1-C subfamily serine protease
MNKQRIPAPLFLFLSILLLGSLACGLTPTLRPVDSGPDEPQISIQDAVATAMAVEFQEEVVTETMLPDGEGVNRPTAVNHSLDLENNLIWLYQEVNPSVVQIIVRAASDSPFPLGSGSGFVYDDLGHIVTNNHVIEEAPDLEVIFPDGNRRRAVIVGTDVDSDLAVIKVDSLPDGVKPVPLGDSAQIQVGQLVVAIGSPFGESGSMSLGIISGLGRSMPSQRVVDGGSRYTLPQVIQTDAPINPGNSGGPLLNLQGEVIGVNSAIRTTTGFNSGVGFAIPVNAVGRIAPALIESGVYSYPYMGVSVDNNLPLDDVEELGVQGVPILSIAPGSPAAQAGLIAGGQSALRGDIIIAVDDVVVRNFDDLISYLVFETEVGQTVQLSVLRDGQTITVPLTLGERP